MSGTSDRIPASYAAHAWLQFGKVSRLTYLLVVAVAGTRWMQSWDWSAWHTPFGVLTQQQLGAGLARLVGAIAGTLLWIQWACARGPRAYGVWATLGSGGLVVLVALAMIW